MPKVIDLPTEIRTLEEELSRSAQARRQLICRVPNAVAILLMRDCHNSNTLPTKRVETIVTDYYTTWADGIHCPLDPKARKALDEIAEVYGVDREAVVQLMITEYLGDLYDRAAAKVRERAAKAAVLTQARDEVGGVRGGTRPPRRVS